MIGIGLWMIAASSRGIEGKAGRGIDDRDVAQVRLQSASSDEQFAECVNNLLDRSPNYPAKFGECCGRNPEASRCVNVYIACKSYYDGSMRDHYMKQNGTLPPDWNKNEILCKQYCQYHNGEPMWCGRSLPAIIGMAAAALWIAGGGTVLYCGCMRKRSGQRDEPPLQLPEP
jgi:hypothetical protein